jgi:hypothetical protein
MVWRFGLLTSMLLVGCLASPRAREARPRLALARAPSAPRVAEPLSARLPEPVAEPAARPAPVEPELLASCTAPRSIVIRKAARELELRCGDAVAGRFAVSLGFAPAEHKEREGDGRTPEGEYFIVNKFPSQFHRSLQLAYPNARDADHGLATGLITPGQHQRIVSALAGCREPPQTTPLGSNIQIHGAGGGPEWGDWTLGCVALDNGAVEAVYAFHERGCHRDGRPKTRVLIVP